MASSFFSMTTSCACMAAAEANELSAARSTPGGSNLSCPANFPSRPVTVPMMAPFDRTGSYRCMSSADSGVSLSTRPVTWSATRLNSFVATIAEVTA